MINYAIGIAATTYLSDGAIILHAHPEDTQIRDMSRRIQRTKTLDGGCVITDGGASAADRTLSIAANADEALWNIIRNIYTQALWVTVATDEACFLAKIEKIQNRGGKIAITILIYQDLTTS